MLSLEEQIARLPFKSDPSDGRRALSVGGDSYRPSPDGAIRFGDDNGFAHRETLAVSSRADDPDYINTCAHEAAHATCALGLGWTVEFCDAVRGETKCVRPPGLSDAEHGWQTAIIASAAKAFAGEDGYGFSADEDTVRALDESWETALKASRKLARDSDVREIYNRIVGALIVTGRVERDELGKLWDSDD